MSNDFPSYKNNAPVCYQDCSIPLWYVKVCSKVAKSKIHMWQKEKLEPVCCKKWPQKVPDQLLVCGIGEL